MNKEEHLRRYFNQVSNLTAVCQSNLTWSGMEYPELEEGRIRMANSNVTIEITAIP